MILRWLTQREVVMIPIKKEMYKVDFKIHPLYTPSTAAPQVSLTIPPVSAKALNPRFFHEASF